MFRRFAAAFVSKVRNLRPLRLLLPIGLVHLLVPPTIMTAQPPVNTSPPSIPIETLEKFEMTQSDLHKHLIVYQKSGHAKTDELAIDLLEIYRELFGNDTMRMVILAPGATNFEEMPAGYTVIRRYSRDVQFVDLARWGSKASTLEEFYSLVMKQINRKLEQLPTLNKENLAKLPSLITPDSDVVLVLRTDKTSSNYIRERMNFESFRQKTQMLSRQTKFCIAEDGQAAEALGLSASNNGSISLLAPTTSKNLRHSQTCPKVKVNSRDYCLFENANNEAVLKEQFIFAPYLAGQPDYTIKLTVNFNKVNARYLNQLYSTFRDAQLEYPVKLIPTNDNDGFSIEMEKFDTDSEWILLEKQPKKQLTAEQKTSILTSPRTWRYAENDVTSSHLKEWVSRVKSGSEQPYYHCQKQRPYERFSNKLVGSTFGKVLQSSNDEVVFYYSRNCSSCKRFGKLYEQLAREYQQSGSSIHFNRLDNDKNKMKEGYNYNYTPVFAYFKQGFKQRPFIYKRAYFTDEYFRHFVELTSEIRIISDERFEEAVEAAKAFL